MYNHMLMNVKHFTFKSNVLTMSGNQNQAYYLLRYKSTFLTHLPQENEAAISYLELQKTKLFSQSQPLSLQAHFNMTDAVCLCNSKR